MSDNAHCQANDSDNDDDIMITTTTTTNNHTQRTLTTTDYNSKSVPHTTTESLNII